ncbi:MAG TPA: hypothetical protein VGE01_04335 [Fimbriimonas sp.]
MARWNAGAAYLGLQGLGSLSWWGLLFAQPSARRAFLPAELPDLALTAFLLPDMILYAGASLASAWGLAVRAPWWRTTLLLHLGAAGYATFYSVAIFVATGEAVLSVVLMLPAFLLSAFVLARCGR